MTLETLLPPILALVVAALAHFAAVVMQSRGHKQDFTIKTFDSVSKELEATREALSKERSTNNILNQANMDLRGINYRLDAEIDSYKEKKETIEEKLEDARVNVLELKEEIFKLKAENALLKKSH